MQRNTLRYKLLLKHTQQKFMLRGHTGTECKCYSAQYTPYTSLVLKNGIFVTMLFKEALSIRGSGLRQVIVFLKESLI